MKADYATRGSITVARRLLKIFDTIRSCLLRALTILPQAVTRELLFTADEVKIESAEIKIQF